MKRRKEYSFSRRQILMDWHSLIELDIRNIGRHHVIVVKDPEENRLANVSPGQLTDDLRLAGIPYYPHTKYVFAGNFGTKARVPVCMTFKEWQQVSVQNDLIGTLPASFVNRFLLQHRVKER